MTRRAGPLESGQNFALSKPLETLKYHPFLSIDNLDRSEAEMLPERFFYRAALINKLTKA